MKGCARETLILVSSSVSDVPQLTQDGTPAPGPASAPAPAPAPLTEAALDEPPPVPANNGVPPEPLGFEPSPQPASAPSPAPLPVPTFNGCRNSQPCSMLEPSQEFDGDIIGDDLDKLLEQADPEPDMVSGPAQARVVRGGVGGCESTPVCDQSATFVSGHSHDEGTPPPADQHCLRQLRAKFLPDAVSHEPFPPRRSAAVHCNPAPALPPVRLHRLLWYGQV